MKEQELMRLLCVDLLEILIEKSSELQKVRKNCSRQKRN